ncbi:hypothetical protein B0H13DRAFT_2051119 [Mycena leptocephala]|nr:hypothetical protein B0H13DRAFT_2051119 [Mycena leptocephala]
MASYVVTGAARGLGLEFVIQLSADPHNTVFAVVRKKATAERPDGLLGNNITILEADITDAKALASAANEVSKITGGKLDYLINNAAILNPDRAGLTTFENPDDLEKDLIQHFKVNTVGTVHCINAFLPLLRMGSAKKVVTISTMAADPEAILKTNHYGAAAYSISKAAVNMAVAKFAAQLKAEGFVFLTISPGVVNTSIAPPTPETEERWKGMTKGLTLIAPGFKGPMTAQESVKLQLEVIYKWKVENTGAFVSHNGNKEWL